MGQAFKPTALEPFMKLIMQIRTHIVQIVILIACGIWKHFGLEKTI